ncbi:hypothetical protein BGZ94_009981 [Podila epigama]|nr:hypothetical protein BGZ94_009981 [Podila epigama]
MDKLLNSSWGRKGNSDIDSSKEPRRKQIESLFAELPTIRAVPHDDSRFQLTLHLSNPTNGSSTTAAPQLSRTTSSPTVSNKADASDTNTVIMTIHLPPGFPEEEPKITIQPTVRHLWVDGTVQPAAVTGHERLMPGGWSSHANLGKIVKEIANTIQWTRVLIGDRDSSVNQSSTSASNWASTSGSDNIKVVYEEYSKKPPPPIPGARSKSLSQTGPTTTNSAIGSALQQQQQPQQQQGVRVTGGAFPQPQNAFTGQSTEARIVMNLSPEQVDELLESSIAFQHFIDHLEVVVNSRTLKNELWLGNDNVSRRNLALESELKELQKATREGYKEATRLQSVVEEKLQQQQDALWRFKPETLQSKLRSAVAESDELSESVAQSFLEGKLDQDSFIRQFQDLRKVYHLREMKNERLGTVLRNSFPSGENSPGNNGGANLTTLADPSRNGAEGAGRGDTWVVL